MQRMTSWNASDTVNDDVEKRTAPQEKNTSTHSFSSNNRQVKRVELVGKKIIMNIKYAFLWWMWWGCVMALENKEALLSSNEKSYCHHRTDQSSFLSFNGSALDSQLKPVGLIPDSCCQFDTVDSVNARVAPQLDQLIQTKFFRNHKTNLNKVCLFWNDARTCNRKDCAVVPLEDMSQIPREWQENLGAVDFTPSSSNGLSPFKSCDHSTKDFCILDDEASADGVYVDLIKNPERFTGYDGEASHRIWRSIYQENCFSHDKDGPFLASDEEAMCTEKRVFYKLISGLHTSITTHICAQNLNMETGEWYADLDCYLNRVAAYPDRVQNLYFTYVVVLRAVNKLAPYLRTYDFCTGDVQETHQVKSLVEGILSTSMTCPSTFDEKLMFTSQASEGLKEQFKAHFRNISRIMDCVSCEKCRLWGKLQVSGLGTALKVLFSYGEQAKDYRLTRTEIVAMFNAFARLSSSVRNKEKFRIMYQQAIEEERLLLQTESVQESRLDSVFSLDYINFTDPRFYVSYILGALVFILGFIKLIQKGVVMDKKYKQESSAPSIQEKKKI